jgi:hypothetical protein
VNEPLPIVTVQVTEDDEVQVIAYVDDHAVLYRESIDVGPSPTWPNPTEQADLVAAAVKEAWLRQYEYYSGEKVDR